MVELLAIPAANAAGKAPACMFHPARGRFGALGLYFPAQAKGREPAPLGTPGFSSANKTSMF